MRRLLLLRHAKTEADAPSGKDFDRRLDGRGRIDAATVGTWLAQHLPLPDLVLVSTAVRAQQTWQLVAEELGTAGPPPEVEHLPELYGAGPAELLSAIRDVADPVQRLLVIGHNPGLHELALTLTGDGDDAGRRALGDNLPTSGIVAIDFAIAGWGEVAFRAGRLDSFVSPKLLKQGLDD
jgi:phosphohistidine phosphatase